MKTAKELTPNKRERVPVVIWDASRLRALRDEYGLTQEQVADAINSNTASLSRLETGQTGPSIQVALRLACFYETTVEYLFGVLIDTSPRPNYPRKNGNSEVPR